MIIRLWKSFFALGVGIKGLWSSRELTVAWLSKGIAEAMKWESWLLNQNDLCHLSSVKPVSVVDRVVFDCAIE